jgi:RNA polymerase sigma-70 factor (ECF subfamily)
MNATRNYRRRAHRRHEALDPSAIEGLSAGTPSAPSLLEQQEDLALFDAALATMDLDQRAPFVLFEIVGMSGPDMAATLEIPLGTAYSRLRLAREAFRRAVVRESARRSAVARRRLP